jgi:hypothetical protein
MLAFQVTILELQSCSTKGMPLVILVRVADGVSFTPILIANLKVGRV